MVYVGSKNRIAALILPIILKDIQPDQYYVEPFCGGCNMIDKVNHPYKIAADNNKYLIALFQYIKDGGKLPDYICKEEYTKVRLNKDYYPDWYVGYIGFICSFRGKYFAGFADNGINGKTFKIRNYQDQQRNNLLKQSFNIKDVNFVCQDYDKLIIPDNSIIYCDIPYNNTLQYNVNNKSISDFDYDKFYEWVKLKVSQGHKVYISEYNMPEDFVCIFEKNIICNLSNKAKQTAEKLFIHKSQINETIL